MQTLITRPRRGDVLGAAALTGAVVLGLVLTGCTAADSDPNTPSEPETASSRVENIDELLTAVDEQLNCPDDQIGDYSFALSEPEADMITGRRCGSIIMVYLDDAAHLTQIRDMVTTTAEHGVLPMIEHDHWLVIDSTEVADGGNATNMVHPESRDLETLAAKLGGTYTER